MATTSEGVDYQLDVVKVSTLAPSEIDPTFRSGCIGETIPGKDLVACALLRSMAKTLSLLS